VVSCLPKDEDVFLMHVTVLRVKIWTTFEVQLWVKMLQLPLLWELQFIYMHSLQVSCHFYFFV